MITDFEYCRERWGASPGWVLRLSWKYDGKPVRSVLLGRNGRHYSKPKAPDDPLLPFLMDHFGMKKAAARLMARKLPKGTEEERVRAAYGLYDKEGHDATR